MVNDWLDISKDNNYLFTINLDECFLRGVKGSFKDLVYARGNNITYFVKLEGRHSFLSEKNTKLITKIINGKLASDGNPLVEKVGLIGGINVFNRKNFQEHLKSILNELGDLLPFFQNVPTQNKFYEREIETLKKLKSYERELIFGGLQDKHRELSYAF